MTRWSIGGRCSISHMNIDTLSFEPHVPHESPSTGGSESDKCLDLFAVCVNLLDL